MLPSPAGRIAVERDVDGAGGAEEGAVSMVPAPPPPGCVALGRSLHLCDFQPLICHWICHCHSSVPLLDCWHSVSAGLGSRWGLSWLLLLLLSPCCCCHCGCRRHGLRRPLQPHARMPKPPRRGAWWKTPPQSPSMPPSREAPRRPGWQVGTMPSQRQEARQPGRWAQHRGSAAWGKSHALSGPQLPHL